jgi:hypothetical protein
MTRDTGIESAIVATLLELNGAELPPNLARMVDHAPESFDDLRHAAIAVAIRELKSEGRTVHPLAVAERVKFDGASLLVASLAPGALPLEAAEYEAESLWRSYHQRRLKSVFGEALAAMESAPDKADSIAASVRHALDHLRGETALDGWQALVEDGAEIQRREIPALVEIVDAILPEQCKLLIGSGSKSFKTWMAIHLGLCIAFGIYFLGRATARRRVLFVNPELRAQAFARRLKSLTAPLGITADPKWFFHLPLRGNLAGATPSIIVSRLIQIARELNIGVIFLDSLFKFNAGGNENDAGAQTLLFNEIDRLTTEAGCTVVLTDHFSKGNQSDKDPLDAIRGSSAKGGDVDAAMILRKHEVEGCFRVDMLHRELPAVEPFVIGWKYPLMELRTDLNPEAMKKPKGGQSKKHDPRELLSAIRLSTPKKPVSISAWAEAGKVSRQTLQGYLPTLRAKGWTATVGEGNTARQHITKAGKEALKKWSEA